MMKSERTREESERDKGRYNPREKLLCLGYHSLVIPFLFVCPPFLHSISLTLGLFQ